MKPLEFLHRQKWIEIATAELTAPAKERIQLEIEAHFTDAVENQLAGGGDEIQAQLAALKELGDPTIAAKRFRQRHLTIEEVKEIERVLKRAYGFVPLLLSNIGLLAFLANFSDFSKDLHVSQLVATVVTILFLTIN